MLRKSIKYALIVLVLALVGYSSVYIRPLDQQQPVAAAVSFNAKSYAGDYMHTRLPQYLESNTKLPELPALLQLLKTNATEAFNTYGKAPMGGDTYYFLVKGEGKLIDTTEEYAMLNAAGTQLKLANAFAIGNAARDASGLVQVNTFNNTMDLNNVSEEINQLIRTEILPGVQQAKKGNHLQFTGCFELKRPTAAAPFADSNITIIPLKLAVKP